MSQMNRTSAYRPALWITPDINADTWAGAAAWARGNQEWKGKKADLSAKLVTSRYDGTALIAAAHLGHDGVVRQLIAAGAPLDHVNNLHWTAVIESIVLGNGGPRHQATLQALIQAGANLQLTDRTGNTPLTLARARDYREMIRMLEKAGAR